jgi:hypothetical protein
MDVMTPTIVIPCYPAPVSDSPEMAILGRMVSSLAEAGHDTIRIVHPPGEDPAVPPPATLIEVPLCEEPETPLPKGWLCAINALTDRNEAVILDHRRLGFDPKFVVDALSCLHEEGVEAALGIYEAVEHPCQFDCFYNVLESHPFIPLDAEDWSLRETCGRFFGPSTYLGVSRPFFFSWKEWTDLTLPGDLFVVQPDLHVVSPLQPDADVRLPWDTVLLWKEARTQARQICVAQDDTVALPFLLPHKEPAVRLRAAAWGWEAVAWGSSVQLFPLRAERDSEPPHGWMIQYPLVKAGEIASAAVPEIESPFLVNVFQHAELPVAEIELPYVPGIAAWSTSSRSLKRLVRGEVIYGRQAFPELFTFDGRVMALASEGRNDPLGVLERRNFGFFPLPPAAEGIAESSTGAESSPLFGLDSVCAPDYGKTDLSGLRINSKNPASSKGPQELVHRLDNVARIRFRFDTVRTLLHQTGVEKTDLPARAQELYADKHLRWCKAATSPSSLQRWVETMAGSLGLAAEHSDAKRLDMLANQVRKRGLPLSWLREYARSVHKMGDLSKTVASLDALYTHRGRCNNLYADMAVEKYLHKGKFYCALPLLERERERGGLTPSNRLNYAISLVTFDRIAQAEEEVLKGYKQDRNLRNGFAAMGWAGYCYMTFNVSETLRLFTRDEVLGRWGFEFAGRKAMLMTHAEGLNAATQFIRDVYADHGRLLDGGYYRVGWEHHAVINHDPLAALPYFEMDTLENRNGLYDLIHSCMLAYMGELEKAESIAADTYARRPSATGFYASAGLLHWLAYSDDKVLRRLFLKDFIQGTLPMWQEILLLLLIETRKWPHDACLAVLQCEDGDVFDYGLRCCLRGLYGWGFSRERVRDLIPGRDIHQEVMDRLLSRAV